MAYSGAPVLYKLLVSGDCVGGRLQLKIQDLNLKIETYMDNIDFIGDCADGKLKHVQICRGKGSGHRKQTFVF